MALNAPDPNRPDIILCEQAAPVWLSRQKRYCVGMDIGQSNDFTALAVIERDEGFWDPNPWEQRHTNTSERPQIPGTMFNVRHLQRFKLGMSYPEMCRATQELLSRAPLNGTDSIPPATLIIDDSCIGRPVGDFFAEYGLRPKRVTMVSGDSTNEGFNNDRWHVSKRFLISTLERALQSQSLFFAPELLEMETMKEELQNFRRKISEAGRESYLGRSGSSDDLINAVALGLWWQMRVPKHIGSICGIQSNSGRGSNGT